MELDAYSGGYTTNSSEYSCPTTGELCAARMLLVSLYRPGGDPEVKRNLPVDGANPFLDETKLQIKLTEHALRAELNSCQGMEGGVCPTRESMDQSVPRTKAVNVIRKVSERFRNSYGK